MMKGTLSIITSIIVFIVGWGVAAVVALLITKTWPESMFGENFDSYIKNGFVWFIGPGVGAFAAIFYTKKWFMNVRTELVYVGFLSIAITVMSSVLIFAVFSILNGNPHNKGWLEIAGLIAQAAAVICGAKLAKNEIPS
jgi:peptidoglycan/LPS O-acetylase OafA/YrhL